MQVHGFDSGGQVTVGVPEQLVGYLEAVAQRGLVVLGECPAGKGGKAVHLTIPAATQGRRGQVRCQFGKFFGQQVGGLIRGTVPC